MRRNDDDVGRGERHPPDDKPDGWRALVRLYRHLRAAGLEPGTAVIGARAAGRAGAEDLRFIVLELASRDRYARQAVAADNSSGCPDRRGRGDLASRHTPE
jgi:hypothetical protein